MHRSAGLEVCAPACLRNGSDCLCSVWIWVIPVQCFVAAFAVQGLTVNFQSTLLGNAA